MAMLDYGVIAKKNGKIINKYLFTDMKQTLGFEEEKDNRGRQLKDDYFIYLGDKDLYIAIHKGTFNVFKNKNELIVTVLDIDAYTSNCYETKYRYKTVIEGVEFDMKRISDNNRYYLRFTYKNDLYEVMYGYGVACNVDHWYDISPNLKRRIERFIGI